VVPYKVFISHGSADLWLAGQLGKEVIAAGAIPFLDEANIPKGHPRFKDIIRSEINESRELIALFTPSSVFRSWVWIEIGAAWSREIPVLAVFYGMTVADLDTSGQGKAILEDANVIQLNDIDKYLRQLAIRTLEGTS
jgi:hypothetical protein